MRLSDDIVFADESFDDGKAFAFFCPVFSNTNSGFVTGELFDLSDRVPRENYGGILLIVSRIATIKMMQTPHLLSIAPLMLNRVTRDTAHLCARLFICLQLLLPSALSYAAPSHLNLSSLLCSPSGQTVSPSAALALQKLAEVLGEESGDEEPSSGQCDKCTLSHVGLPSPAQIAVTRAFRTHPTVYAAFEIGLVQRAQGPPTGSRAPPIFI